MADGTLGNSQNPGGWGGAPSTPTQTSGEGWGQNYWGTNGGSPAQTSGGGSFPSQPPQMQPAPQYQPIKFNPYNPGTQTNAPLNMWAIASGQQQYGPQQQQQAAPTQGGTPAQTTPAGGGGLAPPFSFPEWMGLNNDGGQRRSIAEYSTMMLPYLEMGQNAYQYGTDFNEAQRRFDTQTGMQQQNDTAQRELAYRQQGLSEEQARIASEQWNQQFGWQQQNDQFNQGLAGRDQNLAEWQAQQQMGLQGRGMSLQELQNQQQYGLQQQAAQGQAEEMARRFGLDLRKQDDLMAWNQMQNRLGWGGLASQERLGRMQSDTSRYQTDANVGLQRYLGNQQNQLGWGGLQQQRYSTDTGAALQREQMLQSLGLDTRGLNLQEQNQLATQAYQQQQLAQQAALQRERMAADERMATMGAYGRAQAPQAKFVRNW